MRTQNFARSPQFVEDLLLPQMQRRRYAAGSAIHSPDDPSRLFHFIDTGTVRFSTVTREGDEQEMFELGPRQWFGEISLLSGLAPPHFANAVGECLIHSIDLAGLRRAMDASPQLRDWLLSKLARALYFSYAFHDLKRSGPAEEQVWRYLEWMRSSGFAARQSDGGHIVNLTQKALADRLGMSRSSLSAALVKLKTEGRVSSAYGKLVVKD